MTPIANEYAKKLINKPVVEDRGSFIRPAIPPEHVPETGNGSPLHSQYMASGNGARVRLAFRQNVGILYVSAVITIPTASDIKTVFI